MRIHKIIWKTDREEVHQVNHVNIREKATQWLEGNPAMQDLINIKDSRITMDLLSGDVEWRPPPPRCATPDCGHLYTEHRYMDDKCLVGSCTCQDWTDP